LVSLANTGEMLYLRNRPGNRPSHEGAFDYLDPAVDLTKKAGFKKVRLRGDCHFALTENFQHWDERGVEFVFGVAAHPSLVEIAEGLDSKAWKPLQREVRSSGGRGEPKPRVKERIVEERGYRNLVLEAEHIAEFVYQPKRCKRTYRVAALRKTIKVMQGQERLIPEIRFHFYITNLSKSKLSTAAVVRQANLRCDQENLIEQAKNGVHAMRMPCDTLLANDAYMNIACLAWSFKAWLGLLWPDRDQGKVIRRMEFRGFVSKLIQIPCQVVVTGRQIVQRLLSYSDWIEPLLVAHEKLRRLKLA
jgi:hypothetical protein